MDELTIGEKVYVSSKRAAKITGYAKDYVGQLCREGRVEARLVGRNWYVLEESIMEHRFGAAPADEKVHPEVAALPAPVLENVVWESPTYEAEIPVMVPPLQERPREVEAPRKVVAEMQSAWQEWFATQETEEKALPSGSSDFDGHLLPVVEVAATPVYEEATPVFISHLPEQAHTAPETGLSSEEEVVSLHRSYASSDSRALVPDTLEVEDLRRYEPQRATHTAGSNLVLKSVFVGVAFVAVCVALVGTGVLGDMAARNGGAQTGLVEIIRGSWEYKSIQ